MTRSSGPDSNEDVVRRFRHGNSGSYNRLASIPITEEMHALVGYGYACYAVRHSDGRVTRYVGWKGYSNTTTQHLNLLDTDGCYDADTAPTVAEVIGAVVRDQEPPSAV